MAFLSSELKCSVRVLVMNWTLLALNTCNEIRMNHMETETEMETEMETEIETETETEIER